MKVLLGKYPKNNTKPRKLEVRIDDHDCWGLDHSLALIIHPALIRLQANKHGAPWTDDADVPDELRSINAPPRENDWDTDALFFDRWNWILNEMIWAFGQYLNDEWEMEFYKDPLTGGKFDKEAYTAHRNRMERGTTLFGKYYGALWD